LFEIYAAIPDSWIAKHYTPNTKHLRKKVAFLTSYETINSQSLAQTRLPDGGQAWHVQIQW